MSINIHRCYDERVSERRKLSLLCLVAITALIGVGSPAFGATTKSKVTLTVFAASSLSTTFTEIAARFQRDNPSISLRFSFLASSVLASQMNEGAPADVFAAASIRDMSQVRSKVLDPAIFATNAIVLAFPRSKLSLVSSFADLNQKSVKWLQCAPSVACGAATETALKSLGTVFTKPVSYEPKVASAVTKLLAGEVDAAFIYRTDYLVNRKVLRAIAFPDVKSALTEYSIAVVAGGMHREESQKFVAEILSHRGSAALAAAGFGNAQ